MMVWTLDISKVLLIDNSLYIIPQTPILKHYNNGFHACIMAIYSNLDNGQYTYHALLMGGSISILTCMNRDGYLLSSWYNGWMRREIPPAVSSLVVMTSIHESAIFLHCLCAKEGWTEPKVHCFLYTNSRISSLLFVNRRGIHKLINSITIVHT